MANTGSEVMKTFNFASRSTERTGRVQIPASRPHAAFVRCQEAATVRKPFFTKSLGLHSTSGHQRCSTALKSSWYSFHVGGTRRQPLLAFAFKGGDRSRQMPERAESGGRYAGDARGRGYSRDESGGRYGGGDEGRGYSRGKGGRGYSREEGGGRYSGSEGGRGYSREEGGGRYSGSEGGRGYSREEGGGRYSGSEGGRGYSRDETRDTGMRRSESAPPRHNSAIGKDIPFDTARIQTLTQGWIRVGAEVTFEVFEITRLGYNVEVRQPDEDPDAAPMYALLYRDEIFGDLPFAGDVLDGYIKTIRPDGKIDVTMNQPGFHGVRKAEKKLLSALKATEDGRLPLCDKSDPEEIALHLQMSKRSFKQACGMLYKKKIIRINKGKGRFGGGGYIELETSSEAPPPRVDFTSEQFSELRNAYYANDTPTEKETAELAQRLDLHPKHIQGWFSAQKAKSERWKNEDSGVYDKKKQPASRRRWDDAEDTHSSEANYRQSRNRDWREDGGDRANQRGRGGRGDRSGRGDRRSTNSFENTRGSFKRDESRVSERGSDSKFDQDESSGRKLGKAVKNPLREWN
ncbi:hypothetical protein CYMTET_51358 [Cymbomonas tetramitiformis]|uniref:Homeobox domain-containing protein n=1 Tax=Cymbomonas tetramitiformis TaxID=36881 RepID=A0AAE0BL79_9CHLO|nr:hypothetical protein CYMTET_51358 [Cymbomonas tetramitiformis]